ncbi:MAG: hypothetical protein IJK14_05165 [Clostridia bacterium]|nr:hypothetical protein [Clostridia bacterium]
MKRAGRFPETAVPEAARGRTSVPYASCSGETPLSLESERYGGEAGCPAVVSERIPKGYPSPVRGCSKRFMNGRPAGDQIRTGT